jgi:hypothetical protein
MSLEGSSHIRIPLIGGYSELGFLSYKIWSQTFPLVLQVATNGRAPIEFKPSNGSAPTEAKPAAGLTKAAVADKPAEAKPTAGLTEAEKSRQRAERFGIVTAKDKLAARAKR